MAFFQPFRQQENLDVTEQESSIPGPLSGLGWFFESLDKPAAAVRSAIQGHWGDALWHITPFSDTVGGMMGQKPPDRHYWGDYLRSRGYDDNWKTSLAGFGMDLISDPLNLLAVNALLPGVGKHTITKAGRAAGAHRKSLTGISDWVSEMSRVDDTPAGAPARKMFGGTWIPFGLDRFTNPAREMATWQINPLPGRLGEKIAENYAEFVMRNPITGLVRGMFSSVPYVGAGSKQAIAEYNAAVREAAPGVRGEAKAIASNALNFSRDAAMEMDNIRASHKGFEDVTSHLHQQIQSSLKNGNVIDASYVEDAVREIAEKHGPQESAEAFARMQDASQYQPISSRLSTMHKLAKDPDSLSPEMRAEALAAQQEVQNTLGYHLKKAGMTEDQIEKAMRLRDEMGNPTGNVYDKTVGTLDSLLDMNRHLDWKYAQLTGQKFAEAGDVAAYTPRQLTGTLAKAGTILKGGEDNPYMLARNPAFKRGSAVIRDSEGVPGRDLAGTSLPNALSRDPVLTAAETNFTKEVAKLAGKVPSVVPRAGAPAGNALNQAVVKVGDDIGFVQSFTDEGKHMVKINGEEGLREIAPREITAIFDQSHKDYGRLREFAGYELNRTGEYSAEKAMERLRSHYNYKYSVDEKQLAGIDPNDFAGRQSVIDQLQADSEAKIIELIGKQPIDMLQKGGMFNNGLVQDLVAKNKALIAGIQSQEYASSLLAHGAKADVDGVPLTDFLREMYGPEADVAGLAARYIAKMNVIGSGRIGSDVASRVKPNSAVANALKIASEKAKSTDPVAIAQELKVPRSMAPVVKRFTAMHSGAEPATGEIADFFRKVTQSFKATAYGIFPQSQLRNLASGMVMNATGGMWSPTRTSRVFKWIMSSGERKPLTFADGSDVMAPAAAHGVLDATKAMEAYGGAAGMIPTLQRGASDLFTAPFTSLFGLSPYRDAGEYGLRSPIKEAGAVLGIGRKADGALTFGDPAIQAKSTLIGGVRNMANMVEATNRLSGFMTLVDRGWSHAQAARHVKSIHYDYSVVSNLDRDLKNYMPFWMWMRKNLPMQVRLALENAGGGASNAIRGVQYVSTQEELPKGMEESSTLPVDISDNMKLAVNLKGVFPWEDLHMFGTTGEGITGQLPGVNVRAVEKLVGMTAPPITATIQAILGKELFSGQSIRDSKLAQFTGSPQFAQVAKAFAGRPISMAQGIIEAGKAAASQEPGKLESAMWRLLARGTIGGIRTQEYYPSIERLRHKREVLEQYLRGQPGVGFFERPFIRGGDQAPPHLTEANRMLSQVVQQQQLERESLGLP